jgi:hypothetical protein
MAKGRRRHCRTAQIKQARRKRAEEVQVGRKLRTHAQQLSLIVQRRGTSEKEHDRLADLIEAEQAKAKLSAEPQRKKAERKGQPSP